MTHRVRVLRSGQIQTVVDIDDYDTACQWAYEVMALNRSMDGDGIWAATIESGYLLIDPFGKDRDIFITNNERHEGIVLDNTLLHDPTVDVQQLFGME